MPIVVKAKKSVGRLLVSLPDDGTALWTLEADPDAPRRVDVLRIGDCKIREIERHHTVKNPPGFPKGMAEEFERQGISFGFQNLFAHHAQQLPDRTVLRKRRRAFRPAPDVVMIQVGTYNAAIAVFGYHRRMIGFRDNAGRWVGRLIFPIWRFIAVFLPRLGRGVPYEGNENIGWFVEEVRALWPDARIVVQEPFMDASHRGQLDWQILQRTRDELLDVTMRLDGVEWMPAPRLGTSQKLRGANGLHFNREGSRLVGSFYAQWLIDNGYVVERDEEPLGAQSTSAAPQT